MDNFLIGMPEYFNEIKYRRDLRKEFYGIEATGFESMEEVKILLEHMNRDGYKLTIHFPLLKSSYKHIHPLFLSKVKQEREEAYEAFKRELEIAAQIGAKHILTHYPKPAIINRQLDWSSWRFAFEKEYCFSDEYSYIQFKELSFEMFERLSGLSEEYGVPVIIEHDILNEYTYGTGLLQEMFEKHKNLKFCIDTGRVHMQKKTDKAFNDYKFIKDMKKYTHIVHLWNVKVSNNIGGGHHPVLPEQNILKGWADIEGYLKEIFMEHKPLIMFEHKSNLITDCELNRCYDWVDSIANKRIL